MAMNKKGGFTFIEVLTVVAILAILSVVGMASILKAKSSAMARAEGSAMNLKQFLTYSRIASLAVTNGVIVQFSPTDNLYGGCIDLDGDNVCDSNEQAGLRIPMPDTYTTGGSTYRVVKLDKNVSWGTFSQAGSPPHVAQNMLSGNVEVAADGSYYQTDSGGIGSGIVVGSPYTSPERIIFRRNGTVDNCANGCSFYIYSKKDDDISFHYAVNVNKAGKVSLYQWLPVNGTYRWKLK